MSLNGLTPGIGLLVDKSIVALDLAAVLGTSAKLWMNLQATYDLDKATKGREVA